MPTIAAIYRTAVPIADNSVASLVTYTEQLTLYQSARNHYDMLAASLQNHHMDVPIQLPEFDALLQRGDKLQLLMGKCISRYELNAFKEAVQPAAVLRVDSCAKEGAVLITTIPKSEQLAFPEDGELFRAAVGMQLGLPIPFISPTSCTCRIGENFANQDGFHLLSQCNVGNQRQSTHNAVRDEWTALMRFAGYHCTVESSETLHRVHDDSNARTDITINNYEAGCSMDCDISITDPRCQLNNGSHSVAVAPVAEAAAVAREVQKVNSYGATITAAGGLFMPLVMESYGRWGPKAREFFKLLVDKATSLHNSPSNCMAVYWRSRLCIAMRRAAMKGLLQRSKDVVQRSSWRCAEETDPGVLEISDILYMAVR
jgi:hypothetical protein